MNRFSIKKDFLLDNKPFKILSGAIHYFRVPREDWYHSLYNLKALGFNTVETYVAWNLHEKQEGVFNFEGILDIEYFLDLAKSIGLYSIVRPSPYICAEWDFGGLPSWLLNKNIRIRSSDPEYLKYVDKYYDILLPKLVKREINNGGNILMMQVENEYGSYGEDKKYLKEVRKLMEDKGVTVPLFTSDGPWRATLRAGSLIEDGILPTGNFGSKAKDNFDSMKSFFKEYNKEFPLMCMEFWDGWFNKWGEEVIRRDPIELAESVMEAIDLGSINLYMFHGGTNFGYMSGCSARGTLETHQVTSYDYDAILDESGNPTKKYYEIQKRLKEKFPNIEQSEPLVKKSFEMDINLTDKVSLFSVLEDISIPVRSLYPQTMEELGQHGGYVLYRTKIERDTLGEEKIRIIDARDRAHLFVNRKLSSVQYQKEIGTEILVNLEKKENNQIDLLVEHMGRVNYGARLTSPTQKKGLRTGVMVDLHFILNWEHYRLPLDNIEKVDFTKKWNENEPSFYLFEFYLNDKEFLDERGENIIVDTYIDTSKFGKGVAFINGKNLGRYWNKGPINSLYVPHCYMQKGKNYLIIFETDGIFDDKISLIKKHKYS